MAYTRLQYIHILAVLCTAGEDFSELIFCHLLYDDAFLLQLFPPLIISFGATKNERYKGFQERERESDRGDT